MRRIGKNLKITIKNVTVCYNDDGPENTQIIIFIHGFPFNKSMWSRQVEALKDKYRVIAYDIRGHGSSDEGTEDYSIDLFTSDLIGLMDTLKINKTILCGLSMGGYIALNAITKYPDRFEALILSDTQCIADTTEAKEKRIKAIESIKENGVETFADLSITNLFLTDSNTTMGEEIIEVKKMISSTSKQTLIKTLVALSLRNENCSKLLKIEIPVLIMVGKEDKITPPAESLFMHKKIHNSQMYILDHSGHLANIENHLDFNIHLKEFIDLVTKKIFFPDIELARESI